MAIVWECGIPAAMLVVVAWFLRRTFVLVHVTGQSMEPTLWEGDRVLVRRVRLEAVPSGGLVVFALPVLGPPGVPGDALPEGHRGPATVPPRTLFVLGDNPAVSTDSRRIGCVPASHLLGLVVRRL